MVRHGVTPDVRSFTAWVGAAAMAGDVPAAREVFRTMRGAIQQRTMFSKMGLHSRRGGGSNRKLKSIVQGGWL